MKNTDEMLIVKKLSVLYDEDSDAYIHAHYQDCDEDLCIWFDFVSDKEITLKSNNGRVSTEDDRGIQKAAAIALRDFLLYCYPIEK